MGKKTKPPADPIEIPEPENRTVGEKIIHFCTEFKDFFDRKTVLDSAVGFVLAGNFSQIGISLVRDLIIPLMLFSGDGKGNLEQRFATIRYGSFGGNTNRSKYLALVEAAELGDITLNWGRFLTANIYFVVLCLMVFGTVKIMNCCMKCWKKPTSDWPCPKCCEMVKENSVRCSHCAAGPIRRKSTKSDE